MQEIAYFRTLEAVYVPEGECMQVELSSGDKSEGDYWVGECGEGEVGVLEGPVSLSLGRLSGIIRAPDHEPLFVEKGERVAGGLKLGSVSKRPANVLPPDDWLVDGDVLEGPEARTASRFRAQPAPGAGGADGTEGPEGGKVRTAQRLRAQPTPCAGSADSREGPEVPSSAEESIAGLLDADAPLEMNEVIFSGPPVVGPTEDEVGAFAAELARRYPGASKDVIVHLGRLWAVFKVGGENGLSYKHSKSKLCEPSARYDCGLSRSRTGSGED